MKQRTRMEGGGAMALAERLGWMGSIDRGAMAHFGQNEAAIVQVGGEYLQSLLNKIGIGIAGAVGSDMWANSVVEAFTSFAQGAGFKPPFLIEVFKHDGIVDFKADGPAVEALKAQAAAYAGPLPGARPWWFWPAIVTGGVAVLFLVSRAIRRNPAVAELG